MCATNYDLLRLTVSVKFANRQDREEISESACAVKADLGNNFAHLLRILPYCSRRVTVAFVYAP
jgi:hypothetical protein